MAVYDLFSKRRRRDRGEFPDVYVYNQIPNALRVQVVHIWEDTLSKGADAPSAYHLIVEYLRREYGVFALVGSNRDPRDKFLSNGELVDFFLNTKDVEHALDVIELTLRFIDRLTRQYDFRREPGGDAAATEAIEEFNERAKEHGVGYQYVSGDIIRVDSEFAHKEAVIPALTVLRGSRFKSAEAEFLSAHEHYRHGRKTEVLVDCLKAFESTMKVICDKRSWAYDPTKGARELVRACFDNGLIPSFWANHFSGLRSVLESGVPTPRNKQGGHGAGSAPVQDPPEALLAYVLHMTASTILFLAEMDKAMA